MRWRLTYVLRSHGTSEDEPVWRDTHHTWNIDGVESDEDAEEKARTFLETKVRRHEDVRDYNLVRIVQEEITAPITMRRLRSFGEIKWPKVAS